MTIAFIIFYLVMGAFVGTHITREAIKAGADTWFAVLFGGVFTALWPVVFIAGIRMAKKDEDR